MANDHHHICAFFHDDEQKYRTLLPLIVEGVAAGRKQIHLVHPRRRREHLRRLRDAGIDVSSQQVRVITGGEAGIRSPFDPDAAAQTISKLLDDARDERHPSIMLVGDMSWTLETNRADEQFVIFEARMDEALAARSDDGICSYDVAEFSASVIVDMMRMHPVLIIGGIPHIKPVYLSPHEGLPQRR